MDNTPINDEAAIVLLDKTPDRTPQDWMQLADRYKGRLGEIYAWCALILAFRMELAEM